MFKSARQSAWIGKTTSVQPLLKRKEGFKTTVTQNWGRLKRKSFDHDGTRTHNFLIRSQTPYPLGHAAGRKMRENCFSALFRWLLSKGPSYHSAKIAAGTLRCPAEKLILSFLFLSQNDKTVSKNQFHFWGLLERNVLFMFSRIQLRNAPWEYFTSLKINQLFPCYALPYIQTCIFSVKKWPICWPGFSSGFILFTQMRFFKFFLSRF